MYRAQSLAHQIFGCMNGWFPEIAPTWHPRAFKEAADKLYCPNFKGGYPGTQFHRPPQLPFHCAASCHIALTPALLLIPSAAADLCAFVCVGLPSARNCLWRSLSYLIRETLDFYPEEMELEDGLIA